MNKELLDTISLGIAPILFVILNLSRKVMYIRQSGKVSAYFTLPSKLEYQAAFSLIDHMSISVALQKLLKILICLDLPILFVAILIQIIRVRIYG